MMVFCGLRKNQGYVYLGYGIFVCSRSLGPCARYTCARYAHEGLGYPLMDSAPPMDGELILEE